MNDDGLLLLAGVSVKEYYKNRYTKLQITITLIEAFKNSSEYALMKKYDANTLRIIDSNICISLKKPFMCSTKQQHIKNIKENADEFIQTSNHWKDYISVNFIEK